LSNRRPVGVVFTGFFEAFSAGWFYLLPFFNTLRVLKKSHMGVDFRYFGKNTPIGVG
jgi:hypothetical protein